MSSFRLLFRAELAFLPGDLLLLLDFWDEVFRGERESCAFLTSLYYRDTGTVGSYSGTYCFRTAGRLLDKWSAVFIFNLC